QARGALYLFPKLDPEVYHIRDDEKFVLDLLREQKILVSHGRAFNWVRPDHFRMVTLPNVKDIEEAVGRMGDFLSRYQGN
ncbi:MAG TPA: aminotransferase, partial [Arthrobacter sp.]